MQLALLILLLGAIASVRLRKLTIGGAAWGFVLGLLLYLGGGWTAFLLMAVFFVLGTAATAWKRGTKIEYGIAEENKGSRQAGQVLANGAMGAAFGLLAWLWHEEAEMAQLLAASAFASATADTLSSELGSVYGKKFYHILSWRRDKRGLDGVVSIEGLLIGMGGSLVIAIVYALGYDRWDELPIIVVAGTAGNLADSVAGAAWERRGFMSNDLVNFCNTAFAAFVGWALWMIW